MGESSELIRGGGEKRALGTWYDSESSLLALAGGASIIGGQRRPREEGLKVFKGPPRKAIFSSAGEKVSNRVRKRFTVCEGSSWPPERGKKEKSPSSPREKGRRENPGIVEPGHKSYETVAKWEIERLGRKVPDSTELSVSGGKKGLYEQERSTRRRKHRGWPEED